MKNTPQTLCDIPVHFDGWSAVSVSDLRPYPRNSRKHGDKQVALLAKSIRGQGWRWGIIVSKLSGYIVAGHARREAALLLGLTTVPVIYQDYETPAHEEAYRIADNRIPELATTQRDTISELMRELDVEEFDLDITGYDTDLVGHVLAAGRSYPELAAPANPLDEYPVAVGDVWTAGRHRIVCGDPYDVAVRDAVLGGLAPLVSITNTPNISDYLDTYLPPVIYAWCAPMEVEGIWAPLIENEYDLRTQLIHPLEKPIITTGRYHTAYRLAYFAVARGSTAQFTRDRSQSTVGDDPAPAEQYARIMRNHRTEYFHTPHIGDGWILLAAEAERKTLLASDPDPAAVATALSAIAKTHNITPRRE